MRELDIVMQHPDQFPDDFAGWLSDNRHVWRMFLSECFAVIDAGFKHYSARTILHAMRHHTAIREKRRSEWKLNDHVSPYLARLFALAHPAHKSLFEYRTTKTERKAA